MQEHSEFRNRGYKYDAVEPDRFEQRGTGTTFSVNGVNELTAQGVVAMAYDGNGNGTNWHTTAAPTSSMLTRTTTRTVIIMEIWWPAHLSRLPPLVRWTWPHAGADQFEWTISPEVRFGVTPDLGGGAGLCLAASIIYDGNGDSGADTTNNPTVAYTRGMIERSLEGRVGLGGCWHDPTAIPAQFSAPTIITMRTGTVTSRIG